MAIAIGSLEAHAVRSHKTAVIGKRRKVQWIPNLSRSNSSSHSLASTSTSYSAMPVDGASKADTVEQRRPSTMSRDVRRPSIISRIKSSMSTYSAASSVPTKKSIPPADFLAIPEGPEKRFIDSIGMVIPGVSDRKPCAHTVTHFIVDWRLCAPIEYTTRLADHGITYSDYCLLIDALACFCKRVTSEQKPVSSYTVESPEHFKKTDEHARSLNEFLADITMNWRLRCIPVMVCVESFSLFAPHRITEALIQILHVPVGSQTAHHPSVGRLSFIDPFSGITGEPRSAESAEPSVAVHHCMYDDPFAKYIGLQRDPSRPFPLWPNAIPTSKRELIDKHLCRYSIDPFFREFMRANVDSHANKCSFAKWMIEREDDPFINTHLEYAKSPSTTQLLLKYIVGIYKKNSKTNTNAVNRKRYEHNRRLENRKTVELGSRLRILRFSFRHPIIPPHSPEMTELDLDEAKYEAVTSHIQTIIEHENPLDCGARLFTFGRHRSTEDCVVKVSEYIRKLNASQSKIIWTIEKIPAVYDGFFNSGSEWEISAWNAEEPLALLLQLEKWGVIEKKFDVEEEEAP